MLQKKDCVLEYFREPGVEFSVERLEILQPSGSGWIRYIFAHPVNEEINADCWRIVLASYEGGDISIPLTRRGEWEAAVKLLGRDDFSGGSLHGDERSQSTVFWVDGEETTPGSLAGKRCFSTLVIREQSDLYDPADHVTVIARHQKVYTFDAQGVTVGQTLVWQVDEPVENCFLAMLPVRKDVSPLSFTDIDPTERPVTFGTFEGVRSVTITDGTFKCEFSVPRYPQKMPPTLLVTDNGGWPYHKHYFFVTTTGHSVSKGEVWQSRTVYRMQYLR